jgi:hypothetical protein
MGRVKCRADGLVSSTDAGCDCQLARWTPDALALPCCPHSSRVPSKQSCHVYLKLHTSRCDRRARAGEADGFVPASCVGSALQSTRYYIHIRSPLPRLQRGFTTVAVTRIDYLLHALYNRVACHYPTHSEVRTPIGYRAKAQSTPTPETMHQEKLPRALFSSLLSYFTYLPLPLSISRYLS